MKIPDYADLRALGYSGTINSMLYQYFLADGGSGSTRPDREMSWLASKGFSVGTLNDRRTGYRLFNPPYGPELISNGTFTSGTTGWDFDFGATIAAVGGELEYTSSATGGRSSTSFTCTIGKTYKAIATGRRGTYTGASLMIAVASDLGLGTRLLELNYSLTTATELTGTFVASGATMFLGVRSPAAIAGTGYFDNISVKQDLNVA